MTIAFAQESILSRNRITSCAAAAGSSLICPFTLGSQPSTGPYARKFGELEKAFNTLCSVVPSCEARTATFMVNRKISATMDPGMFNRFTARARQVLFYARSEVSQFGSRALEPEHILLGMLDEGKGPGSRILAQTGGPLDDVRSDIVGRITSGERIPDSVEIAFSASCQRVLLYAAEEADRLSHPHIGTEHLLLGLLREERTVAYDVLAARGVGIEGVREAIVELLRSGGQPEPPGPPPTPASTYPWPQIPFVPSRTVHILYSGMRSPEPPVVNHAGPVFSAYGFTLEDIIIRAWEGDRRQLDITPGLSDGTRFDFLMVLPQEETTATCVALLRSAIEQHFAVAVTLNTQEQHETPTLIVRPNRTLE